MTTRRVPPAVSAYLAETGRKGGRAGTGAAKRRATLTPEIASAGGRASAARARARREAQQALLEAARAAGAYLDTPGAAAVALTYAEVTWGGGAEFLGDDAREEERKRIVDALFAAVDNLRNK